MAFCLRHKFFSFWFSKWVLIVLEYSAMSEYNSQFSFPHVVKLSNKLFITGATLIDMKQKRHIIRDNIRIIDVFFSFNFF